MDLNRYTNEDIQIDTFICCKNAFISNLIENCGTLRRPPVDQSSVTLVINFVL